MSTASSYPASTPSTCDRPLVSVVIPAWNAERFIGEAIQSVVDQTYRPIELIVVDDGSTDGTCRVAAACGFPLTYERIEHAGSGAARNRGVALAGGACLAFLDADDCWPTDKLARQVGVLSERPDLDMVFGRTRELHQAEWDEAVRNVDPDPAPLSGGEVIGAMLIRSEAFRRVGPFSDAYRIGDAIDWLARARDLGLRFLVLPDLALWRRIHGANASIRNRSHREDYARILHASLARRRAARRQADAPPGQR